MWIQQKPNGKYQFFENYKDPLTGKFKTVSVTLPTNKRTDQTVAKRILDEKIHAASLHPSKSKSITFKSLTAAYVKSQHSSRKASTAKTTEFKMKVLCDLIGEESLVKNLTAPYVRKQLQAARSNEEVTNVTYNERLKYFKALMR